MEIALQCSLSTCCDVKMEGVGHVRAGSSVGHVRAGHLLVM